MDHVNEGARRLGDAVVGAVLGIMVVTINEQFLSTALLSMSVFTLLVFASWCNRSVARDQRGIIDGSIGFFVFSFLTVFAVIYFGYSIAHARAEPNLLHKPVVFVIGVFYVCEVSKFAMTLLLVRKKL